MVCEFDSRHSESSTLFSPYFTHSPQTDNYDDPAAVTDSSQTGSHDPAAADVAAVGDTLSARVGLMNEDAQLELALVDRSGTVIRYLSVWCLSK